MRLPKLDSNVGPTLRHLNKHYLSHLSSAYIMRLFPSMIHVSAITAASVMTRVPSANPCRPDYQQGVLSNSWRC